MAFEQDQPRSGAANRPWKPGFLTRLAKDTRGNVLALTAATVIPMIGMVGSGIDMGRTYLVRTRLQQACDAGVLAARKSITGNALDQAAKDQGASFFNINLKTGMYGAENVNFVLSDVTKFDAASGTNIATGTVHGEATADVPMTLMKIFGKNNIALTATCEAEINVGNNDIMFVLDVTGSMGCLPTDANSACNTYVGGNTVQTSGIWHTTEKNGSRISVLRQAVKDFFTTVDGAKAPGTRLRIGFVPYSSGVNVSGLSLTVPANATYITRKANFNSPRHHPSTTYTAWGNDQTFSSNISNGNCDKYGSNTAFTQGSTTFNPSPPGSPQPPTAYVDGGAKPADVVQTQYQRKSATWSSGNQTCVRQRRTATTTYTTKYVFTNWTYTDVSLSTSALNYVSAASAGANSEVTTQGSYNLIELAAQSGTSGLTITPTSRAQCAEEDGSQSIASANWWPAWPDLTYGRTDGDTETTTSTGGNFSQAAIGYGSTAYSCPTAARRLDVMTQAQVNAYVDDAHFVPHGYTYHDIGMLWGARLMNADTGAMFAADHGAAPNGRPVQRHIIFMTDGDMQPISRAYGPYGIEAVKGRTNGGTSVTNDSTLKTIHNARFLAACAAAQQNGVSVWVVAFGQALTPELSACASSSTQTFQASTGPQLQAAFATIAQRIADLRLVG